MKNNVTKQFQLLREIIDSNIKTLEQLFDQSKTLSELISSMKESSFNEENIQNVESSHNEINTTIVDLVKQTKELFDTYKSLVETIFSNNNEK